MCLAVVICIIGSDIASGCEKEIIRIAKNRGLLPKVMFSEKQAEKETVSRRFVGSCWEWDKGSSVGKTEH